MKTNGTHLLNAGVALFLALLVLTGAGCPILGPTDTQQELDSLIVAKSAVAGIAVDVSQVRYNRRTGEFSALLTLTNGLSDSFSPPLSAVIQNITTPTVSVLNADDMTLDGDPFFDVSHLVSDGSFDPGESLAFQVVFDNAARERFEFDVVLVDHLGTGTVSALFSIVPIAGDSPLIVEFMDESTAEGAGKRTDIATITEWLWDFGDGTTSDQRHPYHVYTVPGTYTVSLTVRDTLNEYQDTFVAADFVTVTPGTDSDGDDLSDSLEAAIGTDPNLWDTDGDTFSDGKEYFSDILDPLVPDAIPAPGVTVLNNLPDIQIESYDPDTGTLVFIYTGSTKAAPTFNAGEVLVFAARRDTNAKGFWNDLGGFATDISGKIVSVLTDPVAAGLRFTISMVPPELIEIFRGIDITWTEEVVLRPSGMPMENEPLLTLKGNNLEFGLDYMDFAITGTVVVSLHIDNGTLVFLAGEVDGDMTIWLDVYATANMNLQKDFEADLGTVLIPLGPIPATAELNLTAALHLSFDGTAHVTTGFNQQAGVRFGFEYLHSTGSLDPISEFTAGGYSHEPEFTLNAKAEAKVTVIPKLGISLYSIVGAYVGVRPYLSAHVESDMAEWDTCLLSAGVDVGIDAFASLEANLFIFNFSAESSFPEPPLSKPLWSGCVIPVGGTEDLDGDGIPDSWEITNGVDDPNGDPDGDGLTNLEEYQHGTDPNVADTDGDGASDGDEVAAGTDPNDGSSVVVPGFLLAVGESSGQISVLDLNSGAILSTANLPGKSVARLEGVCKGPMPLGGATFCS